MHSRWRNAELIIILGALTSFAPLAVDMYLPALPTLEHAFATGTAEVQRTLTAFFIGFALGQLFYGPISDRYGRKPPLYASLTLFAIASAGCAMAESIGWLELARFTQALGACAGAVIARAVVRDLYPPERTAKIYSLLILVMGLAPMLAPLAGGYVLLHFGWATIFWILAAIGIVSLLLVHLRLDESHPAERRTPLNLRRIGRRYGGLLRERGYLLPALISGFSMAGMFAYIAGSPFVFIRHFSISPDHYGWFFGANAMGLVIASQLNARWVGENPKRMMMRGIGVQAVAVLAMLAAALAGGESFWGLVLPLFLYVSCLGFVFPNATALAMMAHGKDAGMASALVGTLQSVLAALSTLGIGWLETRFSGIWPMVLTITLGSFLAILLAIAYRGESHADETGSASV